MSSAVADKSTGLPADRIVGIAGAELTNLVLAAQMGDDEAWSELIGRYAPLVVCVAKRFQLSVQESEDVSQFVWLKLWEQLTNLREARALPGWIAATTKHEALRVIGLRRRTRPVDPSVLAAMLKVEYAREVDDDLRRRELTSAVRRGLAELRSKERKLLELLSADPRPSYQEIAAQLGMRVGSIGPTRARLIEKLRNTRAMQTYLYEEDDRDYLTVA